MIPADVSVEYIDIVNDAAKQNQLDAKLLKAIVTVESSWKPNAVRYEPTYKYIYNSAKFAKQNEIDEISEITLQKFSYGLGQIMGGAARELGYTGPLTELCDPKIGIQWSAMKLKSYVRKYAKRDDQIASYNAGSPIMKDGKYINQGYVDAVNKEYAGI